MVEAIELVLREREFRAGEYRVGYQSCNDTVGDEPYDPLRCRQNARAYVATRTSSGSSARGTPAARSSRSRSSAASGGTAGDDQPLQHVRRPDERHRGRDPMTAALSGRRPQLCPRRDARQRTGSCGAQLAKRARCAESRRSASGPARRLRARARRGVRRLRADVSGSDVRGSSGRTGRATRSSRRPWRRPNRRPSTSRV